MNDRGAEPVKRMLWRGVRTALAPLALWTLSACGADAEPDAAVTVTDSAGIRIVHHALPQPLPEWILQRDEGLELDMDLEAIPFQIGAALQLSDGRFAVADGGNHRILFHDDSGELLSTTGRQGEGPGEFQHVTLLARGPADSLLVWDRAARRMSVLEPSGEFARSFALEATEDVPFANVRDVYADGSLLASGFVDVPGGTPAEGRQIYSSPFYHFGPDGAFLAHAGSFPGSETFFEIVGGGGFAAWPVPFGQTAHRMAVGNRLLSATSVRYELRYLSPDGDPVQIVRREARAEPATRSRRSQVTEELVERYGGDNPERTRARLDQMDVPDLLPELGDVFADRLGRVWVEEYEAVEGATTEWRVYDPDGLGVGAIELPSGLRLTDAGEGWVLGVMVDELDVETVVRFPVREGAG